jgi:hypothetical protein
MKDLNETLKSMTGLHESQISKTRKKAGYTLSILASLVILTTGIMKVIGCTQMQLNMSKIANFGDKVVLMGMIELVILVLYWIPRTMNMGFFFLASFCGGFIVAQIVVGEIPIPGIILSTLFYVGTMLRKPSLSGLQI